MTDIMGFGIGCGHTQDMIARNKQNRDQLSKRKSPNEVRKSHLKYGRSQQKTHDLILDPEELEQIKERIRNQTKHDKRKSTIITIITLLVISGGLIYLYNSLF